jgi:hypothetical protein
MAKTLTITANDVEYTLEFTRKTVSTLEKQGFILSDIAEKPMTTLPELFAGAFLAHHRYVKREVIDSIYDNMPNKEDLIKRLAEMYNEPIEALIAEPEESEGNVSWGTNW